MNMEAPVLAPRQVKGARTWTHHLVQNDVQEKPPSVSAAHLPVLPAQDRGCSIPVLGAEWWPYTELSSSAAAQNTVQKPTGGLPEPGPPSQPRGRAGPALSSTQGCCTGHTVRGSHYPGYPAPQMKERSAFLISTCS